MKDLKKRRLQAGLTLVELGRESGVSYSLISQLERGMVKNPGILTIQKIVAALEKTEKANNRETV